MKLRNLWIVGLGGMMAAAVYAQNAAPAAGDAQDKPALPAGHPAIPGAETGLPQGHPSIPSGAGPGGALPSGHPAVGGAGGAALPAGHPGIGGAAAPTTGPAATIGSMSIKVTQATANGPAVGGDAVSVQLYRQGKVIQEVNTKLDQHGVAILEGLSLALEFQPLVVVTHAGVRYEAVGEVMDGQHPTQQVELPVYESTADVPAWRVQMRHVIVDPQDDGMHVMEMLSVENPTDRAWIGNTAGDGKHVTVSLSLPADAQNVQAAGRNPEAWVAADGKLNNVVPLLPGLTQVQVSYVVPVKGGTAKMEVVAPAAVGHLMVFVPDGIDVKAEGVESGGVTDMGRGKVQIFKGGDIKAGQKASFILTPPAKADAGPAAGGASNMPKVIAGVGGGLILAIGTGIVLAKSPKARLA